VEITIRFTKGDGNQWTVDYWDPQAQQWSGDTTLIFNSKGELDVDAMNPNPNPNDPPAGTMEITISDVNGQAADLQIRLDFRKITQAFDGSGAGGVSRSTVELDTRDGRRMGTLEAIYVNELGEITGRYSNGDSRLLAQIALANFNNMAGLIKEGNSTFAESPASGVPQIGTAASGGRGTLVPGNLEGSNVDLAGQFTEMILTQRGYQASAKLVSTADDMLQEIVNLKR